MAAVASPSSTACLCPPSSKFQNPLSRYALPLSPVPRKLRPLHISNSTTSDRYAPEEPRNGSEVLVDSIPMPPITGQVPRRCIVQVIDELTSGSAGVVEHHQMWGAQHYKYIRPPQWLATSGGLGGMGTGRRINPLGFRVGSFRLGTTQTHHSIWFQHPKKYSEELEEDTKIRDCIKKYPGFEGVARIQIHKRIDLTEIMIYMGFPESALGGDRTRKMEELQLAIQKKLNSGNRKLSIGVTKIAKPYADPNILAEFIAGQLTKRVQFRKAMKKAIELTEQAGAKGIQVQIGGRLDGKEIARVEWMREGRVPLQTIRAKIEYCSYPVRTIHGVLGIKVWIYTDEE